MRPLEVTLEGFKSYRCPQTFNFESRSLFGIVGPTGSGKSTILEALIFGLYGKTPRLQRETKKLINSGQEQARVQLIFEVDDVVWEVVRIIRRKGTSQTLLRRLSDSSGDPISGERLANERIEELVGLDFDGFCSSVLLPQGEFDRFLKAPPADRSKILKGIFRLERVDLLRERARASFARLEGRIAVLQAGLEALPADPQALLTALEDQRTQAALRVSAIGEALPGVTEAEQQLRATADQMQRLQDSRDRTGAALARLPAQQDLKELAGRNSRAQEVMKGAWSELGEAAKVLEAAVEAEKAVESQTGGEAWCAEVAGLLARRTRLAEAAAAAEAELHRLSGAAAGLQATLNALEASLAQAEQASLAAGAELARLQQLHSAHRLRSDLRPGQPCPVCAQDVLAIPAGGDLPALTAAERSSRQAEQNREQQRKAFQDGDRECAVIRERLRLAADASQKLAQELQQVVDELTRAAGADPGAELQQRRLGLEQARQGTRQAREMREAADGAERRARAEMERISSDLAASWNLLTHFCGVLGLEPVAAEKEGLWEAAKRLVEAGRIRIKQLEEQILGLEGEVSAREQLLSDFMTRFGAGVRISPANLFAQAEADLVRIQLKMEEIEAGIGKRREAEEQIEQLSIRRSRFERLVVDFSDSRFTAFLLDEQRKLLSRIASEKLLELSGRYLFDDEGRFQIVDQVTGDTRSPDTLSGGETFLASLALALALAEAVALEGGRLGCFFLDEGFGSLDTESLDLALDAIEALAEGSGRLIGLISHVGGIQARLDDLIVLERSGDGGTEVAQYEGPIGYAPVLI